MLPEEIRALTCDECNHDDPGGSGNEEAFRNLLLREIAAQLAELNGHFGSVLDGDRTLKVRTAPLNDY